ncbi:protein gp37 [Mucilaginibacter gossypiicola]|uniref:Protein gp37 n=1 Tax=Mucilaginibacter gossypiicola TaxID=551995 RepID=A0A1H8A5L8_9SPHI|nr:phage Gp37/Gp68 family protein [Mucilaginibacter gossypiicola]SEM65776.1 protein gp37 [Mucilaginibacter gossypiicola]
MQNSSIEWTDHTFNPWWGCMKVSEGCKNCYAEKQDNRYNHENPHWGPNSTRKTQSKQYWRMPFKWDLDAKQVGINAKVFCASMGDVFEDHPQLNELRIDLFYIIINTPNLIWQLLTKRPENILKMVPDAWLKNWPDNVWIGTSVESQPVAEERIPILLMVPAKVRFLSCEPLLGRLDLANICNGFNALTGFDGYIKKFAYARGIDWVICGGESGHTERPLHIESARQLRDQCAKYGVPFFFKQWGDWVELDQMPPHVKRDLEDNYIRAKSKVFHDENNYYRFYKLGKTMAGALLDGVTHKNFPKI